MDTCKLDIGATWALWYSHLNSEAAWENPAELIEMVDQLPADKEEYAFTLKQFSSELRNYYSYMRRTIKDATRENLIGWVIDGSRDLRGSNAYIFCAYALEVVVARIRLIGDLPEYYEAIEELITDLAPLMGEVVWDWLKDGEDCTGEDIDDSLYDVIDGLYYRIYNAAQAIREYDRMKKLWDELLKLDDNMKYRLVFVTETHSIMVAPNE